MRREKLPRILSSMARLWPCKGRRSCRSRSFRNVSAGAKEICLCSKKCPFASLHSICSGSPVGVFSTVHCGSGGKPWKLSDHCHHSCTSRELLRQNPPKRSIRHFLRLGREAMKG